MIFLVSMKSIFSFLFFLLVSTFVEAQTTRAIRPVVLPSETGEQAQLYQNSHALLNGIGGDADTNSDSVVTGSELGQFLFSSSPSTPRTTRHLSTVRFETAILNRETLSLLYNLTSCAKQSCNSRSRSRKPRGRSSLSTMN